MLKKNRSLIQIVARELPTESGDPKSLISTANVTVFIDDQNDNPPVFTQGRYEAVIAENVTAGMLVAQVGIKTTC